MSQFTKNAIVHTFFGLLENTTFDKITVTDIVQKCGINRNTFYYYFQDIYQLVDEIFEEETKRVFNSGLTYLTWRDAFTNAIAFAQSNRKAIYHLYNSACRERLEDYLCEVSRNNLIEFFKNVSEDLDGDVSMDDIEDLAYFYAFALVGVFTDWMKNDMVYDLEAYIDKIYHMFGGNAKMMLINTMH